MPKRELKGTVVSDKGDKTCVVLVERRVMHPIYKKFIRQSKKYMAHDESNSAKIGQLVTIRECRPMSAKKRWELVSEAAAATSAPKKTTKTAAGGKAA